MDEEKIDSLEPKNEIIEITSSIDNEEINEELEVQKTKSKKEKKKKNKKPNFLSKLTIKQKRLILIVGGVVLLLLVIIFLILVVFKKDKKNDLPKEPIVVIEKDNYRYEDGVLVFLDSNDKEIGKYECENKDEKKCYIAVFNNEDEFDVPEIVDENNQKLSKNTKVYEDRYVFVFDNDKDSNIKLYDLKDKKELGVYKIIKEYKNNIVILKDENDKYGLIDLSDSAKEKVAFKYNYIGYITNLDNLVAKNESGSLLIDDTGKELSKVLKGDIRQYNSKYISVLVDGSYYIYDYNGIVVLDEDINYVSFSDEYPLIVQNRKLYCYDSNMNLLNIEGIKLANRYYNPLITIDDKGTEIERKEAFNASVKGSNLSIDVDKEYTLVNIYTGKVNKGYKYISYYNGTIYVYKDDAKENLLGTYACVNLNNVTASTTSYNTCTLAKETELLNRGLDTKNIGYLPLYNNRFIFIQDGENIVFWDLRTKSKKATYKAVDAGYYNKDFDFVTTDGTLLMAKNTSNNFLILKIESENAVGVIGSKDDNLGGATTSIKFLDNNFLVTRADKKYYLYKDSGGKEPLTVSSEEILEYNPKAVKVVGVSKTYNINTLQGKVILGNLLYAQMYENYFVAVTQDKKINVYEYKENAKGLISENIPALTTDDFASSYKVTKNTLTVGGVNYTFSVSGEE